MRPPEAAETEHDELRAELADLRLAFSKSRAQRYAWPPPKTPWGAPTQPRIPARPHDSDHRTHLDQGEP